jgi:oligoribonuclease NrnB/cAMP/cGMP phosphodiesterase (DHH superfamily)
MKNGLKPILFYHGGCPDGFGAAFAFWMKYKDNILYIPMYHLKKPFKGIDPELFKDRVIWMADIALSREEMLYIKEVSEEITVIDHHAGNMEELQGLDFCHFDMNHSGAVLSWNYVFPKNPVPKMLLYIEDRDLHSQKIPQAQELLSVIDSYERDFLSWFELYNRMEEPSSLSKMLQEGSIILKYNKTLIKSLKNKVYRAKIKGYDVPIINTPFFRDEIVNDLAEGEPFAAGYHYDGNNFVFSLRSSKNGVNVLEIAKQFVNGGGHIKASGFSIKSLEELT